MSHDELIARACALRDECNIGVKERGVMPDYVDACVALKGLAPQLLDSLTTMQDREATLIRVLDDVQQAEFEYRLMHDRHGDGSQAAGRAWDLMRRAGDKAREALGTSGLVERP